MPVIEQLMAIFMISQVAIYSDYVIDSCIERSLCEET